MKCRRSPEVFARLEVDDSCEVIHQFKQLMRRNNKETQRPIRSFYAQKEKLSIVMQNSPSLDCNQLCMLHSRIAFTVTVCVPLALSRIAFFVSALRSIRRFFPNMFVMLGQLLYFLFQ